MPFSRGSNIEGEHEDKAPGRTRRADPRAWSADRGFARPFFDLPNNRYMLDDYLADAGAGHNIVASIYCESQAFVRKEGPEWMRALGEVEFANGIAAMTASGVYGKCRVAVGIIGHANMTFGAKIGELLDRCMEVTRIASGEFGMSRSTIRTSRPSNSS